MHSSISSWNQNQDKLLNTIQDLDDDSEYGGDGQFDVKSPADVMDPLSGATSFHGTFVKGSILDQ